MPKKANKLYVARDAVAMLYGLYKGDHENVMAAYRKIFPDDYFDVVRPTDTAVWNAAVASEGMTLIPTSSTYWACLVCSLQVGERAYRIVFLHASASASNGNGR